MNVNLALMEGGFEPIWKQIEVLLAERQFIAITCGLLAVLMTLKFYRTLKGVSSALVYFIVFLILGVLIMFWTQTRTEPPFLTPFIDKLAPFFPAAPTPTPPQKVYP